MNLFYVCEECGHRSFHPICWFKHLFKKPKKICDTFLLERFSQIKPLPKNRTGTIRFRRYSKEDNE